MSEWMPVDEAPRDGTLVDLWVEHRFAKDGIRNRGLRVVGARWGWPKLANNLLPELGLKDGEQWVVPSHPHPAMPVARDFMGGSTIVTHWMLPPGPPL